MAVQFEKILKVLNQNEVEFVVIGGAAMGAHGSAYVTYDLDLCYRRTVQNMERLSKALLPFHPSLRGAPEGLPFRFDGATIKHGLNFTLKIDLGDLDLLGEVKGLGTYEDVAKASSIGEIANTPCLVLSIEGLISAKRAAGRKKDLYVLPELEALLELRKKTNL
jgi:hypothetical protein